jgi:hypothetical protein
MNLIQITEQLKNPAISVPQLMQYANNSNPQVPSYVALAEMQRRQSIQAPAQVPQETVKDQLGAQLMGLPAAPGAPPQTQEQQPQTQPQQPLQQPMQQPMQQQQVPMPEPKPALPTQPEMQPGMAGGGLTSIPLNMHHDFASGGIIAFAGGGEPDPYAMKTPVTEEEAEKKLKEAEVKYNFGNDPYAEAKRRYAELEAKQKEAEKSAASDRIISSLAAMGAGGPRQFGDVMASYANTSSKMEGEQRKEAEQNAMKMADLHTLWAKEQEAMNRARYAAVTGKVKEEEEANREIAKLQHARAQAQAQTTTAEATKRNAEINAGELALREKELPVKLALYRAQALREGRPPPSIEETNRYMSDPKYAAAYDQMQAARTGGRGSFTFEDALKQVAPMMPGESPEAIAAAAKKLMDSYKAYQSNTSNPYGKASDAEIKAALAKLGIK